MKYIKHMNATMGMNYYDIFSPTVDILPSSWGAALSFSVSIVW